MLDGFTVTKLYPFTLSLCPFLSVYTTFCTRTMADALCGPSNALQSFQKHTTVDRTLQQDRLINRQSPTQGFRSAPSANAGVLDPEFDAFQSGHAVPTPQLHLQHHHAPPPHVAQQQPFGAPQPGAQLPGWAADFQRLNISSPPTAIQQTSFRPQASPATASWHQDFLQQQQQPQQMMHTAHAAQPQAYAQNTFGGMAGYGMDGYVGPGFQHHTPFAATGLSNPMSAIAQGNQRAQKRIPQIDEAAFEQAFEQAHADMLEAEAEARGAEAVTPQSSQNVLSEEEHMMKQIRERQMSAHPLFGPHDEELEAQANGPLQEEPTQQPEDVQEKSKTEELPPRNDDDAMAETAGHLLERVADNTSEKFQKSQFLELMRRLRDKEVRVEGDKVVEVQNSEAQQRIPPQEQDSDSWKDGIMVKD